MKTLKETLSVIQELVDYLNACYEEDGNFYENINDVTNIRLSAGISDKLNLVNFIYGTNYKLAREMKFLNDDVTKDVAHAYITYDEEVTEKTAKNALLTPNTSIY